MTGKIEIKKWKKKERERERERERKKKQPKKKKSSHTSKRIQRQYRTALTVLHVDELSALASHVTSLAH